MSGGPPGRVSAILAVYNGERFLAEAIRSMLDQTEPPDEILVVDDGSTDRSAAIARSFPEVTCLAQPNAGQSAALNRGVAASTGELLAFLDADDLWTEEKLARQKAALADDPTLEAVFGLAQPFRQPPPPAAGAPPGNPVEVGPPVRAHLHVAVLMRRPAFERAGGFDPRWQLGGIVDWYARTQEAGLRSRVLDHVVYRRRIHGENLGIVKRAHRDEYLAVVRAALERRARAAREASS